MQGRTEASLPPDPKAEKRNLLSSIFVVMLLGVAYQEMIFPVRDSLRTQGVTLGTAVLFLVFFLTTMRFFIGSQLHLQSDDLLRMKGYVWFYDFLVIVFQLVIMIFLGGVTSVAESRAARVDFIQLLALLYLLDVAWIASQWFAGRLWRAWRRRFIPWAWAALNATLVLSLLALRLAFDDPYSTLALLVLGGLNLAGFVVDVLLIDYFEVF